MGKPKRVKVTVAPVKAGQYGGWKLSVDSVVSTKPYAYKADAVEAGRRICRRIARKGGLAQLVLRTFNNRIQTEWTYPRMSDPRPKVGSARNRG